MAKNSSSKIVATYTDELGEQEIIGETLPDIAKVLAALGYDGPRVKAFEGETLRGWVGADGYTWA